MHYLFLGRVPLRIIEGELGTLTVLQHTPEKQRSRPNSIVSEMLAERRKTNSEGGDTTSILSITSQRADRRRTGECKIDGNGEEKHSKEKRTTVDRMRRKTTDNVISHMASPALSGSAKGRQLLLTNKNIYS